MNGLRGGAICSFSQDCQVRKRRAPLVENSEGSSLVPRPFPRPNLQGKALRTRLLWARGWRAVTWHLTSVVFPCISSPKDILVTPAAKSYTQTLLTNKK